MTYQDNFKKWLDYAELPDYLREDLNSMYSTYSTPGGKMWKHACAVRIKFRKGDFIDEKGEKVIDFFDTVPNSTTQCVKGLNKSNISIFKVKTDVLGNKHFIKKRG